MRPCHAGCEPKPAEPCAAERTAGGVASNGVTFTVVPTPSISSLSPTSGPVGTSVTISGGRVHYARISAGTSWTDAVYQHTSTPTAFYGSTISWNGSGWTLTLKDGTTYVFPESFAVSRPQQAAVVSIHDRYGNTLSLTRDSSSNLTRITSPNSRWISLAYDTSNRATQAKDNMGRVVSYTYDASGRLSTVTDANGGITTYTYDASNNMLTIKDARGIVYLTNQYDANNRVIGQTQVDSTTYQFAYTVDANGNITQTNVTDPRGNVRQVAFNSAGYALSETFALGKPEQQAYTYNIQAGTNLMLSVTDALNRQTSFTYDALGNTTSDPAHNLGPVVSALGTEAEAFSAMEAAVQAQGLADGVFSTVVSVGGSQVTVTGIVINGVARIGTAFIP